MKKSRAQKPKAIPHADNRPSWDDYFIGIMTAVGARSTCDRGKSGALIVKDKRMVSTGYVGAPAGCLHCDEVGHEMNTTINGEGVESRHCVRTTHAEQNAIAQAAKNGVSTDGGTIYVKMTPCYACAKMIINAGIKRVVAQNDYHAGARSKEIFREALVHFDLLNAAVQEYPDKK